MTRMFDDLFLCNYTQSWVSAQCTRRLARNYGKKPLKFPCVFFFKTYPPVNILVVLTSTSHLVQPKSFHNAWSDFNFTLDWCCETRKCGHFRNVVQRHICQYKRTLRQRDGIRGETRVGIICAGFSLMNSKWGKICSMKYKISYFVVFD